MGVWGGGGGGGGGGGITETLSRWLEQESRAQYRQLVVVGARATRKGYVHACKRIYAVFVGKYPGVVPVVVI